MPNTPVIKKEFNEVISGIVKDRKRIQYFQYFILLLLCVSAFVIYRAIRQQPVYDKANQIRLDEQRNRLRREIDSLRIDRAAVRRTARELDSVSRRLDRYVSDFNAKIDKVNLETHEKVVLMRTWGSADLAKYFSNLSEQDIDR